MTERGWHESIVGEIRPQVERILASRPVGLFTDVDGTISPIVPSPAEARVDPGCLKALARLADLLDLVVAVSGRAGADVERLVGLPQILYLSNHGLEVRRNRASEVVPAARPYLPRLAAAVAALRAADLGEGIVAEDKQVTASVHYRLAPDPVAARLRILAALSQLPHTRDLTIREGRMVVEIRPPVTVDKGTALLDCIRRHGLRAAIFVGDDQTDLDGMHALRRWRTAGEGRAVLVAVASPEAPPGVQAAGDLVLPDVGAVGRFLNWLVELASAGRRRANDRYSV